MARGTIITVTAVLIFLPVFVCSNPSFSSRHRRQSFNLPFPLPPVAGSASAEESQSGTSASDPDQNPQGNSNLNNSGTQDKGNDDGNPAGKKFNFSGNKDWDSGQTVPTVDFPGMPLFPGFNDDPQDESEETNATAVNCVNYCKIWDPCPKNKTCVMRSSCSSTECIDKVGTDTPTIEKPTSAPGNNSSSFNKCDHPYFDCVHGNCSGFNCICEKGWQGLLCEKPCTLDCVHGSCLVIDDPTNYKDPTEITKEDMFCNCEYNYEGDRCERLKPDPEETTRILIIVLSCVVPAALILVLVIAIVLWRMRVIFVLKLVYHFRKFVDDDGKLFDAYVSFSPTSKDEEFVYGLLRPILENLGKKLYLPARDSPVGDVMSDNILNAVEQSRCTIMIITADYVSNEWNRFEFLIAQHEALKLQQRIIPVILEKVDQERINKDKSLKNILSSIKCLKYPTGNGSLPNSPLSASSDVTDSGSQTSSAAMFKDKLKCEKKEEKFWKRLELTMPKTKKTESQSESAFESLRTRLRRKFHSDSATLDSHKNHVNLGQSFITLNMTDAFKQDNEDSGKKCQKDSYTNIDLGQIQLNAKV